jgi:hypothetical protein
MKDQFLRFFSKEDWEANQAMQVGASTGPGAGRAPGVQGFAAPSPLHTPSPTPPLSHPQAEISAICSDVAPAWLKEPLSLEATAARYVRPGLRQAFLDLCRRPAAEYVGRFGFKSDLLKVARGGQGEAAGWAACRSCFASCAMG